MDWQYLVALVIYPHAANVLNQYMDGYELFVLPLSFRALGIRFIAVGENIALSQTLNMAYNSLNSPGHRTNILHANFGTVGIGIVDGCKYGLMVTQKFKNQLHFIIEFIIRGRKAK